MKLKVRAVCIRLQIDADSKQEMLVNFKRLLSTPFIHIVIGDMTLGKISEFRMSIVCFRHHTSECKFPNSVDLSTNYCIDFAELSLE